MGPTLLRGVGNVFDQFTSHTAAGATTNYAYTGPRNDERLTAGGTAFLNGSLGITRQTTAGATTSFIRDPNGTLISMRTSTGTSHYYTIDALGSTILLTDTAQAAAATYAYDSWGVTTSTGAQAATNPFTYAGGYNDTTNGGIKFGARYYNPTQGRFTQPDPSGQEANRYLYAGANPITQIDPNGLSFLDGLAGELVGGLVSVIGGVASAAIKSTPWGIGASLAIGCAAGATNSVVSQGISGGGIDGSSVLGSCAGGAAVGLLGYGAGSWLKSLGGS